MNTTFNEVAKTLSRLGFTLSRGQYFSETGEFLARTVVVTRANEPAWNGVWVPWNPGEREEAQAIFEAAALALENWVEVEGLYKASPQPITLPPPVTINEAKGETP